MFWNGCLWNGRLFPKTEGENRDCAPYDDGIPIFIIAGISICTIFGCLRTFGRNSLFLVLYDANQLRRWRILEEKYSGIDIMLAGIFDSK